MTYHRLHHFLTEAPWSVPGVNQRRLKVMNQCSQTRFGLDICLSPAISPKTLMIRPFSIGMLAAAISISGQLDASIIYCQQVQNQACTRQRTVPQWWTINNAAGTVTTQQREAVRKLVWIFLAAGGFGFAMHPARQLESPEPLAQKARVIWGSAWLPPEPCFAARVALTFLTSG